MEVGEADKKPDEPDCSIVWKREAPSPRPHGKVRGYARGGSLSPGLEPENEVSLDQSQTWSSSFRPLDPGLLQEAWLPCLHPENKHSHFHNKDDCSFVGCLHCAKYLTNVPH